MKTIKILFVFSLLIVVHTLVGQEKRFRIACVSFYNMENLFDTIDTPEVSDLEYTPQGSKKWNTKKYEEKIHNMASVIAQIGNAYSPQGPAILGVSEIENKGVLEDLVRDPQIADRNYQIVHFESPDYRGIDVALLYRADAFHFGNAKAVPLTFPEDTVYKTRDQLVVSGLLHGESFHFLVNHWPSRRGGEKASRPRRNLAAQLCRSLVDSIMTVDPQGKIIVMGDLNDDPVNESIQVYMRAKGKENRLKEGELFNPMWKFYKDGVGSLAYRDSWSLFDQMLVSQNLLGEDRSSFKYFRVRVMNEPFLQQKTGRYAGYPFRTHAAGVYQAGYSDHFPVYLYLVREVR